MKAATFNANSIRTGLLIVLEWLEGEQPDVLCIQETKVQDKDFGQLSLPRSAFANPNETPD